MSRRPSHARFLVLAVAGLIAAAPHAAAQATQQTPAPSTRPARDRDATTPTRPGISLAPRPAAGRVTRYTFDIDSSSQYRSTSNPDLDQEQTQRMRVRLRLSTKEAAAAGAVMELAFERVEMTLKTPDVDVRADSAKPAGGRSNAKPGAPAQSPGKSPARKAPPAPAPSTDPLDALAERSLEQIVEDHVKQMASTVLTITTDGAGNITGITGGEGLSGAAAGLPGLGGGVGGMSGMGGAGLGVPPQAIAQWAVSGLGQPDTVRVGQTWSTTSALSGTPVGGMSMATTYTLESAAGGVARIAFRGGADGVGSASAPSPTGVQIRQASYTGSAEWDIERGEMHGLKGNTRVILDTNAAGITASMTSTQTIRLARER